MNPHYLSEGVALVVSAAVIAYVCHRLRILPIVGFLIAGVAIGPNALRLVKDAELIESVAEIGIILLLFTLGIEFSFERITKIRRAIFLGGALQVTLTIAATTALLLLVDVNWRAAVFTGSLVALSSTAIVLKVLEGSREVSTPKGQLAVGMLIFQDLAIVALVLLVPILAGSGGSILDIGRSLGIAILLVAAVLVVARRVVPPVLERVARTCSQEIFLLTIIATCMGTAWLTSLAGVSLSLGAFLAGLVISESRFSHHAFAEILPLQILFSAIFFVSVGLMLDLTFVIRHPLLIAAVVATIIVVKFVTAGVSALALGARPAVAAATALLVAQIGEFSFVLERAGRAAGLFPAGSATGGQTFIAAAVLLMAVTPLFAKAGNAIETKMALPAKPREDETVLPAVELENHVIIAGYGTSARYLSRVLRDSGIPFVILTLSPTGAAEAEREGLTVVVGDYSRRVLLERAAADRAKVLVIPDDDLEMARRVTSVARVLNPTLHIVVRTRENNDVEMLLREGADEVLVDELEIGIQIFTHILGDYGVSDAEVINHVDAARAGGYAMLRRPDARVVSLSPPQRAACEHGSKVRADIATDATGCEECLRTGDTWVHLRACMSCGGVRCCDSSKNRHATRHFESSGHPIIRSYEPDETWAWCYPDQLTF